MNASPDPPSDLPADLEQRARRHAALGDPTRLALVEELVLSDRSPQELATRFGLASNLLAHHLDVLDAAGLVERVVSSGDRRRRYVHLVSDAFTELVPGAVRRNRQPVFVCSRNSARSQLAAALWTQRTGAPATSAGTDPADQVHPGAVAAAARAGLDLGDAVPRQLGHEDVGHLVITVCDRAHEELIPQPDWLHWSLPDPVDSGTDAAFDTTIERLRRRIDATTDLHDHDDSDTARTTP